MYIFRHAFPQQEKHNIERMRDWPSLEYPQRIIEHIKNDNLIKNLDNLIWQRHADLFQFYRGSVLYHFRLNTRYQIIHPLIWKEDDFPDKFRWLFWYLTNKYLMATKFLSTKFIIKLTKLIALRHNKGSESNRNLLNMLN